MRAKLIKVKDKLSKKRKDSVEDASSTPTLRRTSEPSAHASFLGLPAEIRNDIYHRLADSTTLTLIPSSPKKRPVPLGILLGSKQTRQEYRAILLTRATFVIPVHSYNFGSVVRTFESMSEDDLTLMKMNESLWIYLHLAHVPSTDNRKTLRAWCDYRGDSTPRPYFGTGQRIPPEIVFQYDVKFLHHMRPPRPISRYLNGYEMKIDLLRTHARMASRLHAPDEQPGAELVKICGDLDHLAEILKQSAAELDDRRA